MATIQDIKTQIENVNALARANLAKHGVALDDTATIYDITTEISNLESGGTISALIDESGVLEDTEGTATEKVEELIEKANVKGIIFSDFLIGNYTEPTIADLRIIPKPNIPKNQAFHYLFYNYSHTSTNGFFVNLKEVYLPDWIANFSMYMFYNCGALTTIYGDLSNIIRVNAHAFSGCKSLPELPYMPSLETIDTQAFKECIALTKLVLPPKLTNLVINAFLKCTGLTEVTFQGTPTTISGSAFSGCSNITDIYCPWAEGAVANAPWGATNATIHYNWTEGEATNGAD